MAALERTLRKIVEQLRGLTIAARLAVASLAAVLVLALVVVALVVGRSEMAPLGLAGAAGADARARVISYLDGRGIAWEESGEDLLVPSDRKHSVLAQLTEEAVITADQIDFASVIAEDSVFTDRQTRRSRFLVAKMNEVSRMLSEMRGIERAQVLIDHPERTGLGSTHPAPTASVMVRTDGPPLEQAQADAIARVVAGAHAELAVAAVRVVDARTGRAMVPRGDDEMGSMLYHEVKDNAERHTKRTIEAALAPAFPGVIVAVNAHVDATTKKKTSVDFAEPKSGETSTRSRDRTSSMRPGAAVPGVQSNVGNVAIGSGRESATSDVEAESSSVPAFGNNTEETIDPRGYPLKINATILVPRSHFERRYREKQGAGAAPDAAIDAAAFDAIVVEESDRIKKLVEPLVDTMPLEGAVAGVVVVSMFTDGVAAAEGGGPGGAAGGVFGGGILSEGLVKPVGLGALAAVSLLLMFMMVRRVSRAEELPTAEELLGVPPALGPELDVVGEAEESPAAMEGLEIDERAVRRQQMISQINELARTASPEAATLLRRWIKH
jgi:flagellar biosynthesis/type III secretory pathway M-ring protein FliF/YscJ